ncbi:MAG: hypothetical protein R3245_00585 [Kiloniellales bacterium]|nr:hypothetical protein [Kiloniellales bacterium]
MASVCFATCILLFAHVAEGRAGEVQHYVPLSDGEIAGDPTIRPKIAAIAACALPEGTIAVAIVKGSRFEFPGKVGLVPAWAGGKRLTPSEQRWISACMLARFGVREPQVLLALKAGGSTRAPDGILRDGPFPEGFTLHEGGFFGNLFSDEPVAYACAGDRAELEDLDPVMSQRTCTKSSSDASLAALGLTDCGFRFVGFCSQIGSPEIQGIRYEEIIEVYLEPTAR